jgi:hypothetical protein
VLVACLFLACLTPAQGAVKEAASLASCDATRLYFHGLYYRTLKLSALQVDAGKRAGVGTYVPCNSSAPVSTPLRRIAGVRTEVALRDATYPHLLYVEGKTCTRRGGRALLRCLHRATPRPELVLAPPGFAVDGDRYTLLGYASSCWTIPHGNGFQITCIDIAWPGDEGPVAVVSVAPGGTLRFRLGFQPTTATLFLHRSAEDFDRVDLTPGRLITWQVPQDLHLPMIFELRAHDTAGSGEGAYIGRFVEGITSPAPPPSG